ncbi:REP element-mobilizing transposase RayT [Lewinella aquimaris]|uniref:REP element-mobilizing transposase RayT n=1 Tax=Neolewinella aquimaris TaxID=1835722 RepID=A0A840EFI1_9BACT|nr:transposase [Neolewinella aquimaris]MBB4079686.1 REP element-mobilizing transposase RayT [Neolewinella aquimaris]
MHALSTFYRSRLPHLTPIGGTFFITFRVKDAVPLRKMQQLRYRYEREVQSIRTSSCQGIERTRALAKARHHYFLSYDASLDANPNAGAYFLDPAVFRIMADHLHSFDNDLYELRAFCIMPNHVHLLLSLGNQLVDDDHFFLSETELRKSYRPLNNIMRRIKGGSSRAINQYLGRRGALWQKDSYDHYVRDEKAYRNILYYILHNPVKAGLVEDWQSYPFTYCAQ